MVKTLGDYFVEGKVEEVILNKKRFYDKKYMRAIYIIKNKRDSGEDIMITAFYPYIKGARVMRDTPLKLHLNDPVK